MPQPHGPFDAESMLLELAFQRGVIDRAAAQALQARRGQAPMPELLARLALVPEETVAHLKADVIALLNARRAQSPNASSGGGRVVSSSSGGSGYALKGPTESGARLQSTSATFAGGPSPSPSSSGSRPNNTTLSTLAQPASGVQSSLAPGVHAHPVAAAPKAGMKFGRYELVAELGRGGMGAVYRARQLDLDREVALKVLLDQAARNPAVIKRFNAEARSVSKLRHPNVVTVYDVGVIDNVPYFTMDLIQGRNLSEIIHKRELDPMASAKLALELARALAYAHGQGVIHRDLKPPNILIDRTGSPRITDFGIAKDLSSDSNTLAGEFLGTPAYMSPEQAKGRALDADARSDVYSLGAVLFDMLCARPPFVAPTAFATMQSVVNDPPPRPKSLESKIPERLEAIVLRCLEKDPRDRYESMSALAQDLERFVNGDSVEATHVIPGGARRVKLALAIALLVLVVGAGAGGGVWVALARIEADRKAAEDLARKKRLEDDEKAAALAAAKAAKDKARERARELVKAALEVARSDPQAALARAVSAAATDPELPEAHVTLARFYLDFRRDAEKAIDEADLALKLDPQSKGALVARARALSRRASPDPRAALKDLERAREIDPKDATIRVEEARVHLEMGEARNAERVASQAIDLDGSLAPAFTVRALALLRSGDEAGALRDARQARSLDPDDREAQELAAKLDKAPRVDRTPRPEQPGNEEAEHKALHAAAAAAVKAFQTGNRGAAESWLAHGANKGDCAEIWATRGLLCLWLGRAEDADQALTQAIQKDPNDPGTIANRGLARLRLNRAADALADFDNALAKGVSAGLQPAVLGRAQALAQLDRWEDALAGFEHAIKVAPEPRARAHAIHERAHGWLARQKWAEAEKDLDESINLDSQNMHYVVLRGHARLKQGNTDGAAEDLKNATKKKLSTEDAESAREDLASIQSGVKKTPE